jgi:type IV secretory pathway TrbD component
MLSSRPLVKKLILLVAYGAGLVAVAVAFSRATPHRPATVNVRWVSGVTDPVRQALESTWQLVAPQHTEGTTYRYVLVDTSYENIRALVTHPSVEDTAKINRSTYRTLNSPGVTRRQAAMVGVLGAVLLLVLCRWIAIATFWGIVGVCTLAVIGLARVLPTIGEPLLGLPHWVLVTIVGAAGVVGAMRDRVRVSSRGLGMIVAVPQLALLGAVAALSALSVGGFSPLWRQGAFSNLVEAAYEGDRAEVVRLLDQGANPRDTASVDGATRSALEAAVLSDDAQTLQRILTAAAPIDDDTKARLLDLAGRFGRTAASAVLSTAR